MAIDIIVILPKESTALILQDCICQYIASEFTVYLVCHCLVGSRYLQIEVPVMAG